MNPINKIPTMTKINSKPISLDDCRVDEKEREKLLKLMCNCNETRLADRDMCFDYFCVDYAVEPFEQWRAQNNCSDEELSWKGLVKMFNDNYLPSHAFVDWKSFVHGSRFYDIRNNLLRIANPITRAAILEYIVDNAEYILEDDPLKMLPDLKNLLGIWREAARVYQEQLKKEEDSDYTLTLDEIINYVRSENPDAAYAVRAMLRFFAFEKDGWSSETIKHKLREIDHQVLVQGDLVQGNKNVGAHINSVQPGGIGAQTNNTK